MKKLIFMLTAVIFIFTACQKEEGALDPTATSESGFHKDDPAYPEGDPCKTTKMIAEGGEYDSDCIGSWVGNIMVWDDGSTITVIFEIIEPGFPGWVIDATHLYVGPEDDIPSTKSGNPKIGKFPHKGSYTPDGETFVKIILTGEEDYPTGDYVIAAHADVRYDVVDPPWTMETFCGDLPETVTIFIDDFGFPNSYLEIEVSNAVPSTETDWFNGVYEGWCIDEAHGIWLDVTYNLADVYCTTDGEANDLVYEPQNFDNLNWLLNQHFVGEPSSCGGNYSAMDVQYAIWYLMDDYQIANPNCRILELEQLARDNGDGYVPGCGDYVAVAIDPSYYVGDVYYERQKLIIAFPLTCDQGETAWGYGYSGDPDCYQCDTGGPAGWPFSCAPDYGGNAWGWYFDGCQPIPE